MAPKLSHSMALAISLSVLAGGCSSPTVKSPLQQTFVDKLGANVKSGTQKVAAAVMPKKSAPAIPDSIPNVKPGPNVFVAVAQMHERTGNFDEAEAGYRKALEHDSKHLAALIGYARLEDRRSNFEAATQLYRRAIKMHPKEASVHNDLGLCYHRRAKLPEATRELKRAVELEGDNKLYRNNLAAVCVEQGNNSEALSQLIAAHGKSVGHYNLGYLLMQKGDRDAALHHFQTAANIDRNLVAAQQWVAKLSTPSGPYAAQAAGTAYVAQRPSQTQFAPPPGQQQTPSHAPQYGGYPQSPAQPQSPYPVPPQPNRY